MITTVSIRFRVWIILVLILSLTATSYTVAARPLPDNRALSDSSQGEYSSYLPFVAYYYRGVGSINRPPVVPTDPVPAGGATHQGVDVNLSWGGGDLNGDAVTYDVYLEADDSTPDVLVSDDQVSTSYDPGHLASGTHYYWQIVATDEHGTTTTGPVWDLTTLDDALRSFSAPAGTQPNGLAWDGSYLWMSSYMRSPGIYKLDPVDGAVVNVYTPPVAQYGGYGGLAFDGAHLWQADAYGGGIYKLDPADCSVLATIPSPDRGLSDLAWDGQHLWVCGYPSQKLYQIEPGDGTIVAEFPVPPGTGQAQTAGLTYDGNILWLSGTNDVFAINPVDGQVLYSLPTLLSRPDSLAWDGTHLWVASFDPNMIHRLERNFQAFPAPAGTQPNGLAWDGHYLWMSSYMRSPGIYKLDPVDGAVVNVYTPPAQYGGYGGLAFDGTHLWQADAYGGGIYKLNPVDCSALATIPSPDRYLSDLAWDGRYLWVCGYTSQKLYQLEPGDGTVVAEFPVPPGTGQAQTAGLMYDGAILWLSGTSEIFAINPANGQVIYSQPALFSRSDSLAWDGTHLWVASFDRAIIHRLERDIRAFPAPAGTQPNGLAWDGGHLWMSSYMLNPGIYELDPTDGTVVNVYTPPVAQYRGYGGLAFDGTHLWQADAYGSGIYQLDTLDCSVLATIPSPDRYLSDLAWDGQHLWVCGYTSQKLYQLEPGDGTVVAEFPVPPGTGQAQTAGLTYTGNYLWLLGMSEMFPIDPANGQVICPWSTSLSRPDSLAWDGTDLWIASFFGEIHHTAGEGRSFPAPAGTQPNGLAWDGSHLWMSSYMHNPGIYKLDPADGTVLGVYTPPVAWHDGYGGLAWDGTHLWQADAYGSGIYQLDPADCSVLSTIPSPDRSLSDLAWDGRYLWVCGYPSQKLYQIEPSDGTVVATYDVPEGTGQAQTAGLTYTGNYLWLSGMSELFPIDPANGQVIRPRSTALSRPDSLAWDGTHLWLASFDEAVVIAYTAARWNP